jgi:hypothetical protein
MTENLITLGEIDADGAIAETGAEALGTSRGDFLRRGAVGGLGLAASAGLLGGLAPMAGAARKGALAKSDVAILNFALTLEYLEASFYTRAVRHGHLHGDTKQFARIVARHERVHVKALKSVLGGKAVKEPKFDFKGTNLHQKVFQKTSFVLENTGVHAYLGQAGNLKSGALLGTAATIVTVEARHAAAIAQIMGHTHQITPDGAFDVPFSKKKILNAVTATGFIVG